jgi:hypothetical protein
MLSSAQTRAVSSGRSAGVLFQPMKNNPYACMEMYLVEVPPPYTGDTYGYLAEITVTGSGPTSTATVTIGDGTAAGTPYFAGMPMTTNPDISQANGTQRLLRPGDLIQFNYPRDSVPAYYMLNAGDSNPFITSSNMSNKSNSMPPNTMTLTPVGQALWPLPNGVTVPFRIVRQPIKTADPPAQLADGAAIDWYFSGVDLSPGQPPTGANNTNYPNAANLTGTGGTWPPIDYRPAIFGDCGTITAGASAPGPAAMANTCGPVIMMFNATGTVEKVYYSCCYPSRVDGVTPITTPMFYQTRPVSGAYFLVGKIEKIQQLQGPIQDGSAGLPNYQDSDARWVSITRQSGLVTTTEVAKLQPGYTNTPAGVSPAFVTNGQYPTTIPEWAGLLNAVMNSRRYASGNQNSGGI